MFDSNKIKIKFPNNNKEYLVINIDFRKGIAFYYNDNDILNNVPLDNVMYIVQSKDGLLEVKGKNYK